MLVGLIGLLAACGKRTTVAERPAAEPAEPVRAAALSEDSDGSEAVVRLPARRLEAILSESQRYYDRGMRAYQDGRLAEANRAFNDSIDVILRSGYSLDQHYELIEQIERILTGIVDFELNRTSEDVLAAQQEPGPQPAVAPLKAPAAAGSLEIPQHERIDYFVRLFQSRRDRRAQIEGGLSRAGRYLDWIRGVLRSEGLPEELAFVPVVESAYKVYAYSRASAKGLWQFIAPTGMKYGLQINWWIDERSDPEKATYAAARYLRFLYDTFGDWHLALAAYNCGEQRIQRALQSTGKKSFWELIRTRSLPQETKDFVPQILAAIKIGRDPRAYGFEIAPEPPLQYDTVWIDGSIDLQLVARCVGSSLDSVRELNPELRRGITPRDARAYRLKLPAGSRERFLAGLASVPDEQRASYQRYIVQRGDTLARIAVRYGLGIDELVRANRLSDIHNIGVGESLLIPLSDPVRDGGVPLDPADATVARHRVVRGDTLYALARRYGTTIDELRELNQMGRSSALRPGQWLTIRAEAADATADAGADRLTYQVRRGDTLSKIARDFGTSTTDLVRWNNIDDESYLVPGKVLTIYR